MFAITTKFLGPTNTRGSRIKVTSYDGSKTYQYDDSLNSAKNHEEAVRKFIAEKHPKMELLVCAPYINNWCAIVTYKG